MLRASGIMFIARSTGNILFLKRGAGGDHPGEWCFPGGKQEGDETLEECAQRETKEELGFLPTGDRMLWTRNISNKEIAGQTPQPVDPSLPEGVVAAVPNTPATDAIVIPGEQVDFTTFRQFVDEEFMPKLDGEHVAWGWAPPINPPEPLHPGCRIALERLTMDELGIARAIAAGRLTSPQKYENLWLFALRITGTGMAYRTAIKEFVWRDPSLYMNDDFLARCNGLPVIWQHPKKKPMMDSKEFADRVIGAIMLPYLKPDLEHPEVWGIAKILDEDAAREMGHEKKQLSTSPCVVFRGQGTNSKFRTEDGKLLLIEGTPQLLDHLAVCQQGVWDKGEEPSGVQNDHHQPEEELIMADEEKKEVKDDAANGEKLDKILSGLDAASAKMDACMADNAEIKQRMDSMGSRMDSIENLKKGDEKADADKKEEGDLEKKEDKPKDVVADKKDADKEEEKADGFDAKKDSAEIRGMISDMDKRMKPRTDEERKLFADAQAFADDAYSMFGDSAPRPMDGETLPDYRRRLLSKMQLHSVAFKDSKLEAIADSTAFDAIEKSIYADAQKAAMSPESIPMDQLRSFTRKDVTGRQITTFGGQPRAWMSNFGGNRRRLQSVRNAS